MTLLNLAKDNKIELFEALLRANLPINFSYIVKQTKCKTPVESQIDFLVTILKYAPSAKYIEEALKFSKRNYQENYSQIILEFYRHLIDQPFLNTTTHKHNMSLLLCSLVKSHFGEEEIVVLLSLMIATGTVNLFETVIINLSDAQFENTFKKQQSVHQLALGMRVAYQTESGKVVVINFFKSLWKRYKILADKSRESAANLNPVFLNYLIVCTPDRDLELLRAVLKEGLDPYLEIDGMSPFNLAVIESSREAVEVILQFKPYDLLSFVTDHDKPQAAKISPINLITANNFNEDRERLKKLEAQEDLQSFRRGLLKSYHQPYSSSKDVSTFSNTIEVNQSMDDKMMEHVSLPALLIDSFFKGQSRENQESWVQSNKKELMEVLDLTNSPHNYSRLLASFISSNRLDLLSLFLKLKLNLDCDGIKVGIIENSTDSISWEVVNFRPIVFAVHAGNLGAVAMLKEAGAQLMELPSDQDSPLSCAMIQRHETIANYILESLTLPNNQKVVKEFFVQFILHLQYTTFSLRSSFHAMSKRSNINCFWPLTMVALKDNDEQFFNELLQEYAVNDLEVIAGTINSLLRTATTLKGSAALSFAFIKKIIAFYSKETNLYDLINLSVQLFEPFDKNFTELFAVAQLHEIVAYILKFDINEDNVKGGLLGMLRGLNRTGYIKITALFTPLFHYIDSAEMANAVIDLALTAVLSEEIETAKLLTSSINIFSCGSKVSSLLFEAVKENINLVVVEILECAQKNKVDICDLIFSKYETNLTFLAKTATFHDNKMLSVFVEYLLNYPEDLSHKLLELYIARTHARESGNLIGGELLTGVIDKLVNPVSTVGSEKKDNLSVDLEVKVKSKKDFKLFSFKTPDSNKPATAKMSEKEYDDLHKSSQNKLEKIFNDTTVGNRTGTIKTITKYREYGIHYKIRFYEVGANDRRAYLKLKSNSSEARPEYEIITVAKHKK